VARRPLPFDILKRATRCRAKKKKNTDTKYTLIYYRQYLRSKISLRFVIFILLAREYPYFCLTAHGVELTYVTVETGSEAQQHAE